MRIVHVCDQASSRVLKEVFCLGRKMECELFFRGGFHKRPLSLVGNLSIWDDYDILGAKLAGFDGKTIVHVHTTNMNSILFDFVHSVRKLAGPVVWDIHDFATDITAARLAKASAVVVPSDGYAAMAAPARTLVLRSKLPLAFMPQWKKPVVKPSCVLVSGVEAGPNPPYRWYRPVQEALDMPLFIYPTKNNPLLAAKYSRMMQTKPYFELMAEMTDYEFSWCGAANPDCDLHDVATNKFWMTMAAGVRPVVYKSEEMRRLAGEIAGELVDFEYFHGEGAETVAEVSWTKRDVGMDDEIDKLIDFYREGLK